jgi:hypothetical protein
MTHKVYFMNLAGAGTVNASGTVTAASGVVPSVAGLNTGALPKKK